MNDFKSSLGGKSACSSREASFGADTMGNAPPGSNEVDTIFVTDFISDKIFTAYQMTSVIKATSSEPGVAYLVANGTVLNGSDRGPDDASTPDAPEPAHGPDDPESDGC